VTQKKRKGAEENKDKEKGGVKEERGRTGTVSSEKTTEDTRKGSMTHGPPMPAPEPLWSGPRGQIYIKIEGEEREGRSSRTIREKRDAGQEHIGEQEIRLIREGRRGGEHRVGGGERRQRTRRVIIDEEERGSDGVQRGREDEVEEEKVSGGRVRESVGRTRRYFWFLCLVFMSWQTCSSRMRSTTSSASLRLARVQASAVPKDPPPNTTTFFVDCRVDSESRPRCFARDHRTSDCQASEMELRTVSE
jgi:hypothetical protein